jgi:hypothetical protein
MTVSNLTLASAKRRLARGDIASPRLLSKKTPGGNVTRPRAADDFPAIRARLEELRRERAQLSADNEPDDLLIGPRRVASRPELARKTNLPPAVRRLLAR